ncbi:hypothetical protein SESBI_00903 [Sesbania bispinosa]|nr:hypothetical protein SESBI_00903 [Sesbania bispinosa]
MVISYEWQPSLAENGALWYNGFQYEFQIEDILLEGIDPISLFNKELHDRTLSLSPKITNEKNMRDWGKCWVCFLIGGIGGFLYLLLLQRFVDELPGSELITSNKGGTNALFRGLKGLIASFALAVGFAVVAVRYNSGDLQVMLTPKDLIVGMKGFLHVRFL